jgi:hypothetical protein
MGRLQTLLKEAVTATETLTTSLRELQEILGMGEPLVKLPPLPRKRKAMKKLHALARQATKSVRRTRTASKQLDADITRVVQAHAGDGAAVDEGTGNERQPHAYLHALCHERGALWAGASDDERRRESLAGLTREGGTGCRALM